MRGEKWLYTVPMRLRSLLKRRQVELELDEEFAYHIDMKTQELRAAGLDADEARRAAIRAMDGVAQQKEACRDARGVNLIDNAVQDLRYGLRVLARAPGFTAIAVLTLALGIGANTAIFSVIDAVLLKPLGFPDADRIVQVMLFSPAWAPGKNSANISIPEFNVLNEQRGVFEVLAAYDSPRGANLTEVDPPEQVRSMRVSAEYFGLFGANPALGRTFTAEEDRPGGPLVAVISESFRARRFRAADPIGKALSLGGGVYTIVGVLEARYAAEGSADLLLPLQADPANTNPGHSLRVAARLKPGITPAQAKGQLRLAHEEFLRRFPNWSSSAIRSEGFTAEALMETTVGESRRPLLVLSAAVGLVLLIACANVANLLMVRATVRKRELALRAALGASRARIIRQLLVESLLLSIGGGMAGLFVGGFGLRLFLAIRPDAVPRMDKAVTLDPVVLAFTLVLTIATGLLFGVLPAFSGAAQQGSSLIIAGQRGISQPGQIKTRSALVVAEMALALVLLIGAGLLIRTFWALRTVDPGFDAQNVLTMEMAVGGTRFETPAGMGTLIREAERRLEKIPGVIAAAATFSLPLEGQLGGPIIVEGHPDDVYGANKGLVSRRYFDVFRIPVRAGRLFNEWDDENSAAVGIVNEAMAQGRNGDMRWSSASPWRKGGPVGERITMGKRMGPPFEDHTREVVGVAGEVRDAGLNRRPLPMLYLPISQMTGAYVPVISRNLPLRWVVRTKGEPRPLRRAIERELRAASGGLPVGRVRTMEEVVSQSTARDRFNMMLLCAFGSIALVLGAVGVYGLMAYTVQHRTQEIGVRIALGARPQDVRRMVVSEGMRLALIGVLIGVPAGLAITPMMRSLLFGVEARDPVVAVSTAVVLVIAALAATYVPACRATRVDPATALRCE